MFKKFLLFVLPFLITGCFFNSPKVPIGGTKQSNQATMRPYKINGKTYYPTQVRVGQKERGYASWYGPKFHGKSTSNGERYDMHALTAAHKTFPMNTMVKVTNLENKKSIIVRINDRGPFVSGRIIDLSKESAKRIDLLRKGTAKVEIEVVGFGKKVDKSSPQIYTGGLFMVQIGAFRKYSGAKIYKNSFDNFANYKTTIKEFELDGYPIFRVFLTGFRSENEARDFARSGHFQGAFIARE